MAALVAQRGERCAYAACGRALYRVGASAGAKMLCQVKEPIVDLAVHPRSRALWLVSRHSLMSWEDGDLFREIELAKGCW